MIGPIFQADRPESLGYPCQLNFSQVISNLYSSLTRSKIISVLLDSERFGYTDLERLATIDSISSVMTHN
jgi:hypothetical protein